jgi:hypothetical protein
VGESVSSEGLACNWGGKKSNDMDDSFFPDIGRTVARCSLIEEFDSSLDDSSDSPSLSGLPSILASLSRREQGRLALRGGDTYVIPVSEIPSPGPSPERCRYRSSAPAAPMTSDEPPAPTGLDPPLLVLGLGFLGDDQSGGLSKVSSPALAGSPAVELDTHAGGSGGGESRPKVGERVDSFVRAVVEPRGGWPKLNAGVNVGIGWRSISGGTSTMSISIWTGNSDVYSTSSIKGSSPLTKSTSSVLIRGFVDW